MYPNPTPITLSRSQLPFDDLAAPEFLEKMDQFLHDKMDGLDIEQIDYDSFSTVDFNPLDQQRLYHSIDPNNHLLIRGLSCLLKSRLFMGKYLYLFLEEAALLVFVSMEALLSLVRNSLKSSGINNPTFSQVYDIISRRYTPGIDLSEYFEECYDHRVRLVHPDNRFGAAGIPYLEADDYFDTCTDVERLYRGYLLDEKQFSKG